MPKNLCLMRQFTQAEKQHLRFKIRDQRKHRLGATKSGSSLNNYAYLGKYVFLGGLLCLCAFNIVLLLNYRSLSYDRFAGVGVALILLFSHLADNFAKPGLNRRLLKTVYWLCVLFAATCLTYRYWSPYTEKLTVTFLGGQ